MQPFVSEVVSSPAFKYVVGWLVVSLLSFVIHTYGPKHPRVAAFGALLAGMGIDLPKSALRSCSSFAARRPRASPASW